MSGVASDSSTDASTEDEGPVMVQTVARLVPVRYECKWVRIVRSNLASYMRQELFKSWPMLIQVSCPLPQWWCGTYPTASKLLGERGKIALRNEELRKNGSNSHFRCFVKILRGGGFVAGSTILLEIRDGEHR